MNKETPLLRQIHPAQIKPDGTVSSLAFRPMSGHDDKLSNHNGDLFTPEESYVHSETMGLRSVGVFSIECFVYDELCLPYEQDDHGFVGHVSVSFAGLSKGGKEKLSARLREHAIRKGWAHRPNC
jgi:hypothetical protein